MTAQTARDRKRKQRGQARPLQCCLDARKYGGRSYKCRQHLQAQGNEPGDKNLWWMPQGPADRAGTVAGYLHQYAQIEFPRGDGSDAAETKAQVLARGWTKANYGMVPWATSPGAQAAEVLKGSPDPGKRTTDPEEALWREKLPYGEWDAYVRPDLDDDRKDSDRALTDWLLGPEALAEERANSDAQLRKILGGKDWSEEHQGSLPPGWTLREPRRCSGPAYSEGVPKRPPVEAYPFQGLDVSTPASRRA